MQNTRLTVITNAGLSTLELWFLNPWRRISLYLISPLFGFFLASIITSVSGANSTWDPYTAAVILLIAEVISFTFYRKNIVQNINMNFDRKRKSLFLECLNLLKIGLIYGMFLEAFKLGS
jgi:CHASE2 domain-containing sensor protein